MVCMWKHIYRLYGCYLIFFIEQLQVARLSGWIATYVNNTFGLGKENDNSHIGLHGGTRWVGNDDIRTAILIDEILGQNVFQVNAAE